MKPLRVRVKSLYTTMRALYEQIAGAGHIPGLGDAARRPARLRQRRGVAPMGGAVVGFTKAYKRERTEALVKAVDFEAEPQSGGNC